MLSNGNVRSNNRASARGRFGEDFYLLATLALFSVTHAKLGLREGGHRTGLRCLAGLGWADCRAVGCWFGRRERQRARDGRGRLREAGWCLSGKLEVVATPSRSGCGVRGVLVPPSGRGLGLRCLDFVDRARMVFCLPGLVFTSGGSVVWNSGRRCSGLRCTQKQPVVGGGGSAAYCSCSVV